MNTFRQAQQSRPVFECKTLTSQGESVKFNRTETVAGQLSFSLDAIPESMVNRCPSQLSYLGTTYQISSGKDLIAKICKQLAIISPEYTDKQLAIAFRSFVHRQIQSSEQGFQSSFISANLLSDAIASDMSMLLQLAITLVQTFGVDLADFVVYYGSEEPAQETQNSSIALNQDVSTDTNSDGKPTCSKTSIPDVVLDALKQKLGFRFDSTSISLLASQTGVAIDDCLIEALKKTMYHRDDDVYFLLDSVADVATRNSIVECAEYYLDKYDSFELSELFNEFEDRVNYECIRDAFEFEGFYSQICARRLCFDFASNRNNRLVISSNASVDSIFENVALKIVDWISKECCGTCYEDDLHAEFSAFSNDLLGKIIKKHANKQLFQIKANNSVRYQTFGALGLPDDFSAILEEELARLDSICLDSTQTALHTAISLRLNLNFIAEYKLPDWDTFRRVVEAFYISEPLREWNNDVFVKATDYVYTYIFDVRTRGFLLTKQTEKYVASEIRPVFAPELSITGLGCYFEYDSRETRPLMWGMKNTYLIAAVDENGKPFGRKVAQLNNTQFGKPPNIQVFFEGKLKLEPVDIEAMVEANAPIMDVVVADAKRRIKELYNRSINRCDIAYIAFSGGKDSVTLLDLCHRVLPFSIPVVFSDTDMELPDTYKVWEEVKLRYKEREFITAKAQVSALDNWIVFAPPSRTIRWCCSVHKSTPAILYLKKKLKKSAIKVMAFVGACGDESHSRSFYEDATDGVKNASQMNQMPIQDWDSPELWLYIFANNLLVNEAYKKGLTRVGCLMCPESAEKYEWLVGKLYPRELKPYCDIIIGTSSKHFDSSREKTEYIGKRYWQARRSGIVLRDYITSPLEENNELSTSFLIQHFRKGMFYEWIKTLGTVVEERENNQQYLKIPRSRDNGIPFVCQESLNGVGRVCFEFRSKDERTTFLPLLRALLRKVTGCVSCQSCEAECSFGAITTVNGALRIAGDKCVKCRSCYVKEKSCWRYRSKFRPENSNSVANQFACYYNFGLREVFIEAFLERGDTFFQWDNVHPIGNKKVDATRKWFPQALLVTKDRKPTKLVDLFKAKGTACEIAWEFVWAALVNNSPLINWYCVSTEIGKRIEVQSLLEFLQESFPLMNNAKDRRLDALKNTAAESPLGGENNAVMQPEYQGKKVVALTRKAKVVHQLTILYSLYLIAELAGRGSFTVRELLTADIESIFVSPIVAFGIAPDLFKKMCEDLRTRYPDYISTTFTLGNDGIEVYPLKHSLEDIVNLALGE